jgi:polyhydroxyalkanoate synthesis regulator phasin
MSRDRKKLYIEMLEEKQKTLTKKLLNKKKELEETKNYIDRIINQNKAMSGFTASRHQMIKNLENVLQASDLSHQEKNDQINQIIDNLRYRIGAAGKERISTINEYFRQIVNLSLPALHRYMMWSATE